MKLAGDRGPLTRQEIAEAVSARTGLPQALVHDILQHAIASMTDSLASGRGVALRNFGMFDVVITKPRVGRNPAVPGSRVPIPARAGVRFKAGKELRERVRKLSPRSKRG